MESIKASSGMVLWNVRDYELTTSFDPPANHSRRPSPGPSSHFVLVHFAGSSSHGANLDRRLGSGARSVPRWTWFSATKDDGQEGGNGSALVRLSWSQRIRLATDHG